MWFVARVLFAVCCALAVFAVCRMLFNGCGSLIVVCC